MKILAAIFWIGVLLGSCAGCVTLTEEEQEQREYERQDRQVRLFVDYQNFKLSCAAKGGSVQIERRGHMPIGCLNRDCPPRRGDRLSCNTRNF